MELDTSISSQNTTVSPTSPIPNNRNPGLSHLPNLKPTTHIPTKMPQHPPPNRLSPLPPRHGPKHPSRPVLPIHRRDPIRPNSLRIRGHVTWVYRIDRNPVVFPRRP